MQRDTTRVLLQNLLSQMARFALNPKIRINRNEVTFSAEGMAQQKMDLSDAELKFLKAEAARRGLRI